MELTQRIAHIIDDKKGADIVIIDISGLSSFADFFINATASNTRMLDTIVQEIDAKLSADGIQPKSIEGKAASGWVLADYGDVIVNIFLEEQRNTYQIEKLWSDGAFIEFSGSER
ncbi:MAG: ribosome silencing factor [Clostridiales Family XIII bacterium]|jgi:ribosome-associated protein|nr:ribosome silencing factor [Clostridiales Family XIII bacterium]